MSTTRPKALLKPSVLAALKRHLYVYDAQGNRVGYHTVKPGDTVHAYAKGSDKLVEMVLVSKNPRVLRTPDPPNAPPLAGPKRT
jgi:hypothetical protein